MLRSRSSRSLIPHDSRHTSNTLVCRSQSCPMLTGCCIGRSASSEAPAVRCGRSAHSECMDHCCARGEGFVALTKTPNSSARTSSLRQMARSPSSSSQRRPTHVLALTSYSPRSATRSYLSLQDRWRCSAAETRRQQCRDDLAIAEDSDVAVLGHLEHHQRLIGQRLRRCGASPFMLAV